MSTIINTYPVFEKSQVLTNAQLNQLVAYLDQQNRLTRVKLIGMGIVCGLELDYDDSGADTHITISKGVAITSEGFLISVGNCETSYYRPYELPEGVEYKPFGFPEQDVTLYELLREMPEDTTDVESLDDPATFLDDKFVLLFLEVFDNDLKSCLGQTCDDLGIDRVFTVRKLLISKTDLDKVLTRSGNVGNLYPDKLNLPDIKVARVLFDPTATHSTNYTAFSQRIADAFRTTAYTTLFGSLGSPGALADTYTTYEPLLAPVYNFTNPFDHVTIANLKNTWKTFFEGTASPGPTYRGIQYFHDFLKDLVLAYDEFRKYAFDLVSDCCPDMSLFPRHVMLGRAIVPDQTEAESTTYRHGFTQPPIYNNQKYLIEKVISLHKRMVLMVEKFNLGLINNPPGTAEIRITPSFEKKTPLSLRAIPYYYKAKETSTLLGSGTLERHWNFDISRTKSISVTPLIVCYENQRSNQLSAGTTFETPLYYNIDDHGFLRIEGHINKNVDTSITAINSLIARFNLPVDTLSLQLDPNVGAIALDYDCGFEDLQEEYLILRNLLRSIGNELNELYTYIKENADAATGDDEGLQEDIEALEPVIGKLHEFFNSFPDCLHDLDFPGFQKTYKELLELTIDFVLVQKELLGEVALEPDGSDVQVMNDILQRTTPIIYKFIDVAFYTKMYRLWYGFARRSFYLSKAIAANRTFQGYLIKHPGLEHQAGVYPGGTFVLIYNNATDKIVVGDFSLPYRCCGSENCIPMCDGEDDEFHFDHPPFARPDYAVTLISTAVDIDVLINDIGLLGTNYVIEPDGSSDLGGTIASLGDPGPLRYTPPEDVTGVDKFRYRLVNADTGATDEGVVTIVIKEEEEVSGCYTSEQLLCWGIGRVRETLQARGIDDSGMNDTAAVNALLESLRESKGFTDDEINGSVLEDQESREQLVKCIGYMDNDYNYEEQGQRIRDYQADNCGATIACTSTRIVGTVRDETGAPLPGANIIVVGTSTGTVTDASGRYVLNFGQPGQTIRVMMIGFSTQQIEICNQTVVDIMLSKFQPPEVEVNLGKLDIKSLSSIAVSRNIALEESPTKTKLLAAITGSEKANKLNRTELQQLTNETLRTILDEKSIEYTPADTKQRLIDKLFMIE